MIEIKNISSGYGNKPVLKNLSVDFEKGRLTSIIGPNGSGKSTLLKTLIGVLPRTSGSILIDGTDTVSMPRADIAKRIAYLPQGRAAPDMTVGELVLHGRFPHLTYPRRYSQRDRDIADAAMVRLGIFELAERPLSSLSGGMRQTAYIAMALAQDTDYILLDEPSTYLDISHQINLMKILRALTDDSKGIICVMHDLPMALTFSDSVAVMQSGELLSSSPPEELSSSNLIEKLFGVKLYYENREYGYRLKP
ncbi:MAG: ABC transporter ATP-binding protein [Ruminococcaceae bacterium]|nr:ABC transporter ATP-binding protein [Oscillospiraceae bacterium]